MMVLLLSSAEFFGTKTRHQSHKCGSEPRARATCIYYTLEQCVVTDKDDAQFERLLAHDREKVKG